MRYLDQPRHTFRIKLGEDPTLQHEKQGPFAGYDLAPLCLAASFGLVKPTQEILNNAQASPPDICTKSCALRMASIKNFQKVTQMILDIGCNVNSGDMRVWTALHHAAYLGHEQLVDQLLSHTANIKSLNTNGDAPLSSAAEGGHADIV